MKQLIQFALIAAVPFSVLSCKDKEASTTSPETGSSATSKPAAADSHGAIISDLVSVMDTVTTGMSSIKDAASAEKFSADAKAAKTKLEGLIARAKALPEPTEAEYASAKEANETAEKANNEKMGKFMMAMQNSTPEAQEAIGKVMEEMMGGEFGNEMERITNEIDAFYKIKDDAAEDEDPESEIEAPVGQ